jgi:hypothetical protein
VYCGISLDDIYGKEGLEDGAEPMTKERAMRIFQDFFRFGEAMDPDAPERSKGLKRAAGGVVYAPVKGLMYGGKSVLSGVIMGSAAVVAGAGAMVANVAFGVKEMGEAGVNAARKRKSSKAGSDSGSEAPNLEGAWNGMRTWCELGVPSACFAELCVLAQKSQTRSLLQIS